MPSLPPPSDTDILLQATGRTSTQEAILWLAEDHPVVPGTSWSALLRALVQVVDDGEIAGAALRRVVREATDSAVDTAKVVFDDGDLRTPARFAAALEQLRSRSGDGTLAGLVPRDVLRAQNADSLAVEALCLAAGIPYSDARKWFGSPSGDWRLEQVARLLDHLTALVDGRVESPIPRAFSARAVELIFGDEAGWPAVDRMVQEGVPYPVLLSQRAVGGVWLAHKNATSSFPNLAAADALCARLGERRIDFRRATTVGGTSRQRDLQQLSGIPKKQVGVVTLSADERPVYAVAFSSARDGGTARANGDGLLQIPVTEMPLALLLTGLGWSRRPETDRLARRFAGRLFTDRTIDDLVDQIEAAVR